MVVNHTFFNSLRETTVRKISVSSPCTVHSKFPIARHLKDPLYTNEKAGLDIKDTESH